LADRTSTFAGQTCRDSSCRVIGDSRFQSCVPLHGQQQKHGCAQPESCDTASRRKKSAGPQRRSIFVRLAMKRTEVLAIAAVVMWLQTLGCLHRAKDQSRRWRRWFAVRTAWALRRRFAYLLTLYRHGAALEIISDDPYKDHRPSRLGTIPWCRNTT